MNNVCNQLNSLYTSLSDYYYFHYMQSEVTAVVGLRKQNSVLG